MITAGPVMRAVRQTMPDPKKLKVGDRIRFVSLPEKWRQPGYFVDEDTIDFMKILISRRRPCRVSKIDENGTPWIDARIRGHDGVIIYHSYDVIEHTGWRRVEGEEERG